MLKTTNRIKTSKVAETRQIELAARQMQIDRIRYENRNDSLVQLQMDRAQSELDESKRLAV